MLYTNYKNPWSSLHLSVESFLHQDAILIHYFRLITENWSLVFEPPLYERIFPLRWKNRALVLMVEDDAYRSYCKMRSDVIASKVRAILGCDFCLGVETEKVNSVRLARENLKLEKTTLAM